MDSKTGRAIVCDKCSRQYTSQSAYFRHRKAHDCERWYRCAMCKLKFSRLDVLQRHQKMHNAPSDSNQGRKRAVRACDECRKRKLRCDASQPCSMCIKSGKTCIYLTKPSRLSLLDLYDESTGKYLVSDESSKDNPVEIPLTPSQSTSMSMSMASQQTGQRVRTSQTPVSDPDSPRSGQTSSSANLKASSNAYTPQSASLIEPFAIGTAESPTASSDTDSYQSSNLDTVPSLVGSVDANHARGFTAGAQFSSLNGVPQCRYAGKNRPKIGLQRPMQEDVVAAQELLVNRIVTEAAVDFFEQTPKDTVSRCLKRASIAGDITSSFELSHSVPVGAAHVMHSFVTSYFDHFHALWPISWRQGFDYDASEPLLYLTMTSIGAMYSDSQQAKEYGLAMHKTLRPVLLNSCLAYSNVGDRPDAIFEALLLTEVMALYLGDSHASAYVSEASAILVAHARRRRLFSEQCWKSTTERLNSTEDVFQAWIAVERRRRLAFGFFRCEVFSSVVFNTRPLVAPEEVDLRMPCARDLWTYTGPGWREALLNAMQDERASSTYYSELVHQALNGDMPSLISLTPASHDLLLYGLQIPVWTFCQELQRLRKTCASNAPCSWEFNAGYRTNSVAASHEWPSPSQRGSGYGQSLTMSEHSDHVPPEYTALQSSLTTWKIFNDALFQSRSMERLLYHMVYVRLNADLETLHRLVSGLIADDAIVRQEDIHTVANWANTAAAQMALYHACKVWCVIEDEMRLAEQEQQAKNSSFNILSIVSLYHAASIIWSISGLCADFCVAFSRENEGEQFCLSNFNKSDALSRLGELAPKLSPSWDSVSLYFLAVQMFATKSFHDIITDRPYH